MITTATNPYCSGLSMPNEGRVLDVGMGDMSVILQTTMIMVLLALNVIARYYAIHKGSANGMRTSFAS
jgi:hypothetical protein